MKTVSIILISILFSFQLFAQYSSLGKIDTVTTGDCDDATPVLIHGTSYNGFMSQYYQWLLFGRNTATSSEIIGKKFLTNDASWDSSETVISSSNILESQRNPEISVISYYPHTVHFAAWERKENNVWNIYYSRFMDNDSAWRPSQPLTQDTVDNTNIQIRPLSDSTFIAIWKRKSTLLYSLIRPTTISIPETIAVGTSDSMEFDFFGHPSSGIIVWTSRDTANKNIMILRSYDAYQSFSLTAPDTLFYLQSVYNPRLNSGFSGDSPVFFETFLNGNREIMSLDLYSQNHNIENISNDSLADDRNPRSFTSPQITKRGIANKKSYFSYYGIFTMEKYTRTDSMLTFSSGSWKDTVKSLGHNRNICIGSNMSNIDGNLSVVTVWESNRTGRSHIYSRLVKLPIDGVESSITSPNSYYLRQNYPNPFNPITNIQFTIAHTEFVSLRIFDLLGREVTTIVNENLTPGVYERQWDAGKFASGVYFYRLTAGTYCETKKLLLLK